MLPVPEPSRSTNACLVVFTKPGEPGRVKTRLTPRLSYEQAAILHDAFQADLLSRLEAGDFDLRVAWALDDGQTLPDRPVGPKHVAQVGADLGARLHQALAAAAADGHARVAAVGSDHPELMLDTVHEAFARLDHAQVVIGPSADGGYYLIAMRAEAVSEALFEDISWSTPEVFEATRARIDAAGLSCHRLPIGFDVDDAADLDRLVRRLRDEPALAAACPRTCAVVASLEAV